MKLVHEPSDLRLIVRDTDSRPAYHPQTRGISFQMRSGMALDQPVRVIVTLQAIAGLFRLQDYIDVSAAMSAFEEKRDQIELAANEKFARLNGVVEVYEHVPTLLLMTGDIRGS